jgi:hypothetical protein
MFRRRGKGLQTLPFPNGEARNMPLRHIQTAAAGGKAWRKRRKSAEGGGICPHLTEHVNQAIRTCLIENL